MSPLKSLLLTGLCLSGSVISSPVAHEKRVVPFSRIVAFGDNLSDNGNGSVAHGVAQPGQPKNSIYGFNTWTNGPVAVMYLTNLLGRSLPLLDFAYGHASGGSKFGATIDNAYTQSTAKAPSTKDQIANYTVNTRPYNPPGTIGNSLHFLWIGANDINLYHINPTVPKSTAFGDQFAPKLAAQVQTLINNGANYIFVPNLYAKNLAPSRIYYCGTNATRWDYLGNAISYANTKIAAALKPFGDKVLVYNTYGYMTALQQYRSAFGISHIAPEYCDGYSQAAWEQCVIKHMGSTYYWMQALDPTTHVHSLLAGDMAAKISAKWG